MTYFPPSVPNYTTAWTPGLSGTGWALGNGTASGTYIKAGKLCQVSFLITFGSTSTFGTGALSITGFPFNCPREFSAYAGDCNAGGSLNYPIIVHPTGQTNAFPLYIQFMFAVPGQVYEIAVTSTQPATWASGNKIYGSLLYETV